jgi:cytochrome d ubiquinol oxidase subunit I
VAAVHLSFQTMLGAGLALIAIAAWAGWRRWRTRGAPPSRAFLRAVLLGGPLAVLALEAGWMVTELGRQPWIVQGVMRVKDAVTDAPGTRVMLAASIAIYAMLAAGCVVVLRRLGRRPVESRERGA